MLIQIGSNKEPAGVAGMLRECHNRIRHFIGVALNVARTDTSSPSEIQEAARRVARYFSEALPLHIADEEESIDPRLAGRDTQLDASLQTMRAEHLQHEADLRELLDICARLGSSPGTHGALKDRLLETAQRLERAFSSHLEQEERIVLPAIERLLSQEDKDAIIREMRSRRDGA